MSKLRRKIYKLRIKLLYLSNNIKYLFTRGKKVNIVSSSKYKNRIKEDLDNKDVGIISVSEDIFFIKNARKRSPEILKENLTKLHKAIIFRASSFRGNGSVNMFSQFYPPKFISSWELKSCNQ